MEMDWVSPLDKEHSPTRQDLGQSFDVESPADAVFFGKRTQLLLAIDIIAPKRWDPTFQLSFYPSDS